MLGTRMTWGRRVHHAGAVGAVDGETGLPNKELGWSSVSGKPGAGSPGGGRYVRGKSTIAVGIGAKGAVCSGLATTKGDNTTLYSCTVSSTRGDICYCIGPRARTGGTGAGGGYATRQDLGGLGRELVKRAHRCDYYSWSHVRNPLLLQ